MIDDSYYLLKVIADIREKTGLGCKPMLSELADAIQKKIARYEKTLRYIANENVLAPPAMVANHLRETARAALEAKE